MAKRGSYLSRMIAQNVSRHTVPRRTPPTIADVAASVWTISFPDGGTRRSFEVLALDAEHAAVLAAIRQHETQTIEAGTPTITRRPESAVMFADLHAVSAVLAIETRAEYEDRQGRYAAREAGSRRLPQSLPNDTEPERSGSERSDG